MATSITSYGGQIVYPLGGALTTSELDAPKQGYQFEFKFFGDSHTNVRLWHFADIAIDAENVR
jgi:hypothetical protein